MSARSPREEASRIQGRSRRTWGAKKREGEEPLKAETADWVKQSHTELAISCMFIVSYWKC